MADAFLGGPLRFKSIRGDLYEPVDPLYFVLCIPLYKPTE